MQRPAHPSPRGSGFTLLELLVTVAIAAVLMMVAAPPLARLVHSVQLSMTSNTFLASLRFARSEALKRASRVALCKSGDGATCALVGGWEQGWIIFHDSNGNGLFDAADTLLQRGEPVGGSLLVSGNQPVARSISFVATGGPRATSGGMLGGTLTLCRRSDAPGPARRIVIGTGGRVRVVQDALESCG